MFLYTYNPIYIYYYCREAHEEMPARSVKGNKKFISDKIT